MKKRFQNRKAFEDVARQLGIRDMTHHVVYTNPYTKQESFLLVNNFSRFVDGMLKLSPNEQFNKLQEFKANMEELVAAQQAAREAAQEEIKDIKIEDPMSKIAQEVLSDQVSDDAFKPI